MTTEGGTFDPERVAQIASDAKLGRLDVRVAGVHEQRASRRRPSACAQSERASQSIATSRPLLRGSGRRSRTCNRRMGE